MTSTATARSQNSWDFDFSTPYPTQDSDLLKQLSFIPGLKEILMARQVHALEHATVWVLGDMARPRGIGDRFEEQQDNETLGGLSTDRGFYLYGPVNRIHLGRAVRRALERLKSGEWDLALHPRCGTNTSVSRLLTAGFFAGISLLFPRGPLEQLFAFGIATTAAAQLSPDLGNLAQKHLTTSIPFNLEVDSISQTTDLWGRSAYFIGVRWCESSVVR
ncbi:hypothetical protein IQ249_03805 [Lusitaniella coriacea LEGE 07157]|uniref:Uncharacterized protein n=1 Tax=Lusitaniella coriacea LEGE 07157 TaxID=945747 RepID=A0A8J7B8R1_9CYAN|nr:DUF6391 domain-containing protein [Lusitaniella coriacea]MBE9115018.1 hypothetical protein [Lusitaniella coriacea LEGE 07157]